MVDWQSKGKQVATKPEHEIELIVVAGTWPMQSTGHGIGRRASLKVFTKWFKHIHYFGPDREKYDGGGEWADDHIQWNPLPMIKGPLWARFIKSIATGAPAITVQYHSATSVFDKEISKIIERCEAQDRAVVLIYDDAPSAYFLPRVRRSYPDVIQVVHSGENLLKGFTGIENQGSILARLAWRFELAKIRRFERKVCSDADFFWATTKVEANDYRQLLEVSSDGVFGISVEPDLYSNIPNGDSHTVVHVGSADLRKGMGLKDFIDVAWPVVRSKIPNARLVLGGRGTEQFDDADHGVVGLGFVPDDREVLRQGQISINPQKIGAGIQIKSVVAMLSGKALVSTPLGVEGVEGIPGEHFFVSSTFSEMAKQIILLMQEQDRTKEVANRAQIYAGQHYSDERLLESTKPLIEALVQRVERRRRSGK